MSFSSNEFVLCARACVGWCVCVCVCMCSCVRLCMCMCVHESVCVYKFSTACGPGIMKVKSIPAAYSISRGWLTVTVFLIDCLYQLILPARLLHLKQA